jgi:hypothetical protein
MFFKLLHYCSLAWLSSTGKNERKICVHAFFIHTVIGSLGTAAAAAYIQRLFSSLSLTQFSRNALRVSNEYLCGEEKKRERLE